MITKTIGTLIHTIKEYREPKYYTDSEKHTNQFVGRIPTDRSSVENALTDREFAKTTKKRYRKTICQTMQLSIILYSPDAKYTYMYAQTEDRWDKKPFTYYTNKHVNGSAGVRRAKKILSEDGFTYEPIRP